MTRYGRLLLLAAFPLITACAVPITSNSHFQQSWTPERGTGLTFGWRDSADRTAGDSRLEGNEFFHERVHQAVAWELSLRGLRYSEVDPDILIHHHLSLADHELENEMIDEMGVSYTETYVYENGSLVIHLVDADTNEDAWVGWGSGNVEPAFKSPDAMRRWVYRLVGEIFDDWPLAARR